MSGGRAEYVEYLAPGILLIAVAGVAQGRAISEAMDMTELQLVIRNVKSPITVRGVDLARGDSMLLVIAAANRDPDLAGPDVLDIAAQGPQAPILRGRNPLSQVDAGSHRDPDRARDPDLVVREDRACNR
jgi:hypothetical protein